MVKAVVMVTSMVINHYPGHRFRDQIPKEDNPVTPSVKEGNLRNLHHIQETLALILSGVYNKRPGMNAPSSMQRDIPRRAW